MNKEKKSADQRRIAQMDRAAAHLLKLVQSKETSEAQKARLFAQCLAWQKARSELLPSEVGGKLKEMQRVIQSKGNSRDDPFGPGPGRGPGRPKPNPSRTSDLDGKAIRRIIRSLPSYSRGPGGDPESAQCEGGSAAGDDGGNGADRSGDVDGNDASVVGGN